MVSLKSFYTLCVYWFERNVSMNVSYRGSSRDITKFNTRLLATKRSFSWIFTSKAMDNNYASKASFKCFLRYRKSGLKFYRNNNSTDDTACCKIVIFLCFKAYYH